MQTLRYRRLWIVTSAFLLVIVLVAALIPMVWLGVDGRDIVRVLMGIDKWAHFLSFAFLATWFGGLFMRRHYWRVALGLFVFGLLIEMAQRLVGYRTADPWDMIANSAGIILGLGVAALWLSEWPRIIERLIEKRSGAGH